MANFKEVEDYSPAFRVTFANVASPNTFDEDKPVYDIRALFPKTMDMAWFTGKVAECAQLNGLVDAAGNITVETPQIGDGDGPKCFTKANPGEVSEQYDGHNQHWWLKFRTGNDRDGNPQPFGIVGIDGRTTVEAGEVYNGMWMRACYKLFPFDHPKFGLKIIMRCEHLQVLGHDTPFKGGGTVSTAKKFEGAAPAVGLPSHVIAAPAPVAAGVPQAPTTPAPPVTTPSQPMAPGEYTAAVSAPTPAVPPVAPAVPQMGPNAQGHTYEKWKATGQTDEQLRAAGVIL